MSKIKTLISKLGILIFSFLLIACSPKEFSFIFSPQEES